MFEKVNPCHPDKVADRIAGAIVDLAYKKQDHPKVAVEVLIGHGVCHIINETSCNFDSNEINEIVKRITSDKTIIVDYVEVPQDEHLANNQKDFIRCGDNGIFKGMPITDEQFELTKIAHELYDKYNSDGKYLIDNDKDSSSLVICQSNADKKELEEKYDIAIVNPLGDWTGGTNVDSGATNRKLGSDMGDGVTGGGLHGKDLSKADVSVNIYCFLLANIHNTCVEGICKIGSRVVLIKMNNEVELVEYSKIVEAARKYINTVGGFEKFAEWGLIR